ncbi:MAG: zinc ABC transporter substrate-binding protein [Rhodospirillales bacterium]
MHRYLKAGAMSLLLALSSTAANAEAVRVVASIKPVHSLVSMILDGIAEPYLIVRGASSPHGHAMRPSDAQALAHADAVFWVGPDLETFLVKPLETLSSKAKVVALMHDHPHEDGHGDDHHGDDHQRGAPEKHDHDHDKPKSDSHGHQHGDIDPHVWLSPTYAVQMLEHIADVMAEIMPAEAGRIAKNRDRSIEELIDIEAEVRRLVTPMHGETIVVLHEAYDHFTEHFGLQDFIALTVTPEHKPTPGRISEVKKLISDLNVRCVFAEPQYPSTFVTLLTEGSKAQPGVIDPLGANLQPGPGLYPELLRLMGFAIRGCYEETP